MILKVIFTNPNPDTIYNKLAVQLGRTPTHEELTTEVTRILRECAK